jgi:deoxyribonuclease V
MKLPRSRHRWNLSPRQAILLQKRLAAQVLHVPLPRNPRYIAGGDAAFAPGGTHIIAAWVVWDSQDRSVVDSAIVRKPLRFPYVPGLLSFREAPALIAAARKLRIEPDVCMLDGHGLAHPRRFGIACHVGLLLDRPCLGCAKSLLCGDHQPPGIRQGSIAPLIHKNEEVGRALRTRSGVKPVFVSVGHKITLDDAVAVVLQCTTAYRLPEPARLAHRLVTQHRDDPE